MVENIDTRIVVGSSVRGYGGLVGGAIEHLVAPGRSQEKAAPAKLAIWILERLHQPEDSRPPSACSLERKELSYFLFSSSRRAQVVQRIVDRFLDSSEIPCFVDHGAGLAIIPLCIHFARAGGIKRVVCSEIKRDFVIIGKELWGALGYGDRLTYQECSATEMTYPESVTVVLFAQMLYRLNTDQRRKVILAAWQALDPGGLLIVNELMDRPQAVTDSSRLTSQELLDSLPMVRERWLFWGNSGMKRVDSLDPADALLLRRSDNFLVVCKGR